MHSQRGKVQAGHAALAIESMEEVAAAQQDRGKIGVLGEIYVDC